tara:strand:- start:13315 stop:13557 length:243 start_codon:yes stop_codon:yes gene_type:complete
MAKRQLLFAIKCRTCYNEFVYCIMSKNDTRCYKCKGEGVTVEDVEAELEAMDNEERESFKQDIKEYELEHGKIDELQEES